MEDPRIVSRGFPPGGLGGVPNTFNGANAYGADIARQGGAPGFPFNGGPLGGGMFAPPLPPQQPSLVASTPEHEREVEEMMDYRTYSCASAKPSAKT